MIDSRLARPVLMTYSARRGRIGASDVVYRRSASRYYRVDVADTLHHPVLASVALDERALSSAQDQGRLVTAFHRKSGFGQDIQRLATALTTALSGDEA